MSSQINYIQFRYRLKSEANLAEHWRTKHLRHKREAWLVKLALKDVKCELPCTIRLIRIASKLCDDDNLISAFKHIRDVVADHLVPGLPPGRADNDPRLRFEYDQKKGSPASVRIEFIPLQKNHSMAFDAKTTEDIIHECKKLLDFPVREVEEMDLDSRRRWLESATSCLVKLKCLLDHTERFGLNKIPC